MLVYLNGLFLLVGGLFIVTSHNRWQFDRAVFVTVSGWLLVVSGAYRMFFPTAQQLAPGPVSYSVISALGILSVVLSTIAFRD